MSIIIKGLSTVAGGGGIVTKGYGVRTFPMGLTPNLVRVSDLDQNVVAGLISSSVGPIGGRTPGSPGPVKAPTPTRPLWFVINWLFGRLLYGN